ncbi:MAG: glycosyltransferase [Aquihabitans sp.]
MPDHPALSIVVPAFNEADRLPDTLPTLLRFLAERPERTELVVVDDGSTDGTATLAREIMADSRDCTVLELQHHQGKGAAVRAGVTYACGRQIMFMDADLATDLADLDPVLAALATADIALGSRRVAGAQVHGFSPTAALAHRSFGLLARSVTGVPVVDFQCGFKAFRGPVAKAVFEQVREPGFAFDVEVLAVAHRMGYRIVETPVRWRVVGGSHVRLASDSVAMMVQLVRIRRRVGSIRSNPDLAARRSR